MSSAEDPFANCFSFSWTRKIVEKKMKIKPSHLYLLCFLVSCR